MLAGLTILAMFSFVFLGVIADLMGTRGVQNPVVVRTSKYGNLHQYDLNYMRSERLRLFSILEKMVFRAFNINPAFSRQLIENRFGTTSEEDVVNTWLKARRAEELGMIISNQTIIEFLLRFCQNKLPLQDVSILIKQEGLAENQFFEIVREQLRTEEAFRLFSFSLGGTTPGQRWNYFCQLRRQATIELIPLKVEQFLDKIENPNEAELKAYFDRYKDKMPTSDSPEPGFRIPQKIDLQYFKAEFDKFSAPDTITAEEIQNCYEKNRDYFQQSEKQSEPALKPAVKASPEKENQPGKESETNKESEANKKSAAVQESETDKKSEAAKEIQPNQEKRDAEKSPRRINPPPSRPKRLRRTRPQKPLQKKRNLQRKKPTPRRKKSLKQTPPNQLRKRLKQPNLFCRKR